MLGEIFGEIETTVQAPPNTTPLFRLADVMPDFAEEVHRLLVEIGESALAGQVPHLWIYDRCPCGGCATMYVQPRPENGFGPTHRGMTLDSEKDAIYIDVAGGKLACLEVLDRTEMTEWLVASLP
jgi:hypothetical protein